MVGPGRAFAAAVKNKEKRLINDYQRLLTDLRGQGRGKSIKTKDLDLYFDGFLKLFQKVDSIERDACRYNDPRLNLILELKSKATLILQMQELVEADIREANAYSNSTIKNIVQKIKCVELKSADSIEVKISIYSKKIEEHFAKAGECLDKNQINRLEQKLRDHLKGLTRKKFIEKSNQRIKNLLAPETVANLVAILLKDPKRLERLLEKKRLSEVQTAKF